MKRPKLAGTFTYVALLATGGTHLLLAAWGAWTHGTYIIAAVFAAWAVMLLAYAVVMGVQSGRAWMPEWTHRFELTVVPGLLGGASGAVVRCNRCDATVLPRAVRITLPRFLAYAHTHTSLACEPRRKTDPEDTRRVAPEHRRRFSRQAKRVDRP